MSIYKIWDNVPRPIGIIYIIQNNDTVPSGEFIRTMTANGYITVQACEQHYHILQDVQKLYRLPVIVFGWGKNCRTVRNLVAHNDLCTAGVCVSESQYIPRIVQWFQTLWKAPDSNKPMLEISCGTGALNAGCTLAQKLYQQHRNQNIQKTTFIIYPDSHTRYDAPEIRRDTLEFLNEIRWQ